MVSVLLYVQNCGFTCSYTPNDWSALFVLALGLCFLSIDFSQLHM